MDDPRTIETRRAFDAAAPEYDRLNEDLPGIRRMRSLTSREYLRYFAPGSRLLELNCGTGNDALFLARHGMRVLATDLSPLMLEEVKKKVEPEKLQHGVDTRQMAFGQIGELRGEVFDGVYSNLGGLNCTDNLPGVAADLAAVVKPGGFFIATVMPPFCLWETAAFLARFRWRRAFRRLARGGTRADLHGGHVQTYYYTPGRFCGSFSTHFDHVKTFGMVIFMPPPNFDRSYASLGRTLRVLERLDDMVADIPPFTSMGDHYTIILRRNGVD